MVALSFLARQWWKLFKGHPLNTSMHLLISDTWLIPQHKIRSPFRLNSEVPHLCCSTTDFILSSWSTIVQTCTQKRVAKCEGNNANLDSQNCHTNAKFELLKTSAVGLYIRAADMTNLLSYRMNVCLLKRKFSMQTSFRHAINFYRVVMAYVRTWKWLIHMESSSYLVIFTVGRK